MLFLKHGEKNPNFLFAPGRESNDILWKNVNENPFFLNHVHVKLVSSAHLMFMYFRNLSNLQKETNNYMFIFIFLPLRF